MFGVVWCKLVSSDVQVGVCVCAWEPEGQRLVKPMLQQKLHFASYERDISTVKPGG